MNLPSGCQEERVTKPGQSQLIGLRLYIKVCCPGRLWKGCRERMIHKTNSGFLYDVVVSFAGEDRAIVEKFVRLLDAKKITYFYDEDKAHDLWGRDLTT